MRRLPACYGLVPYTPDVFIPAVAGHLLDHYAVDGLGYRYFFFIMALFAIVGVVFAVMFRYFISTAPAVPRFTETF
jgi:MFS family permease